jgi:hypothetical protein
MTRIERRHKLYLEERLKEELSEHVRGSLRAQLQSLRETVRARQQVRDTAKLQTQTPQPPQRKNFPSDKEWETATELFRLDLTEKACLKKLDSPKTSLSGLQTAERELKRIAKRRAALQPPKPVKETVQIDSPVDWDSIDDEELLNQRNVAAAFALFSPDDRDEHLAAQTEIEIELDNRGVDWKFWCSGHLLHLFPNRKQADKLSGLLKRNRLLLEAHREAPMLNSRSRTVKTSDIPLHTRNVSGSLPVRSVIINSDSLEAFEMKIKMDKQKEQEQMEVKAPISNDTHTGTTKEQNHGNATWQEILDVTDYEVSPLRPRTPKSKQAKTFAKADTAKIAEILGSSSQ